MALSKSNTALIGNVFTTTISFSSGTAVAGRLIICGLNFSTGSGAGLETPAGWTPLVDCQQAGLRSWLYYKYADGTETGASWSWSSGGYGTAFIAEYDDQLSGDPVVVENESLALVAGSTSISTGTASASFSAGRAIGYFTGDSGTQIDGGRAYSNGFAEELSRFNTSYSSVAFASKAINASGNYETTFSCVDVGDELYAAMFLFQSANIGVEGTFDGSIAVAGSVEAYAAPQGSFSGSIAVGGSFAANLPAIGSMAGAIAVGGSATGYAGHFADDFVGTDANVIVLTRPHWTGYDRDYPTSLPTSLRILSNRAYFDARPATYYVVHPDVKPPANQTVSANFVAGSPGLIACYERPTGGGGYSGGYIVIHDNEYGGGNSPAYRLIKLKQNNDGGGHAMEQVNVRFEALTGSPLISLTVSNGNITVRRNGEQIMFSQDSEYTSGYAGIFVGNEAAATGTLDNYQQGAPVFSSSMAGVIALGGSLVGNIVANGNMVGTIQPSGTVAATFSLAGTFAGVVQVGGFVAAVRGAAGTTAAAVTLSGSFSAGHGVAGAASGLIQPLGGFTAGQGAGGDLACILQPGGRVEAFHVRFIADTPGLRAARAGSGSRTARAA